MTRFPKDIPSDTLSRADELLSAKYGTDRPIDPEIVELVCRGMMEERERLFAVIEEVRVSAEWSGQHADWICGAIVDWANDPSPRDTSEERPLPDSVWAFPIE